MKFCRTIRAPLVAIALAAAGAGLPHAALAQSSSLYGAPGARQPLLLERDSWTYIPVEPVRDIQVNDLVTIVVLQSSQVLSEGEVQRRTQSNVDYRLQDWIKLDGFGITPAPQPNGDPRARGQYNQQIQTTANLETTDSIKFRITARVVDIRPNGSLVLEAHNVVRNNDEVWEASLTGICRREDVKPDNTVLSERVYELTIHKREVGHIRDSYKRGWLLTFIDRFKPF